jgi:hypothetical protein
MMKRTRPDPLEEARTIVFEYIRAQASHHTSVQIATARRRSFARASVVAFVTITVAVLLAALVVWSTSG